MKTIWKNFWTLTKRRNAGFTLVELIVVIAILAILAGVGVPVYSGYVTKANKQADMTLVSDIEHALTLAGYSGTFEEGEAGYLIISANNTIQNVAAGSNLEKALVATFGAGYPDILKLKYDEWGCNSLLDGLTYEYARAVTDSSYMKGNRTGQLLEDVETITKMAAEVVSVLSGSGAGNVSLSTMFGDKVLADTAAKYNITIDDEFKDDQGNVDWNKWGAANGTRYGNFLVLAAAEEADKALYEEVPMSDASNLIVGFAGYYAYAAQDEGFSQTLSTKLGELDSLKDAEDPMKAGAEWYNELKTAAESAGYDSYQNDDNGTNQYNIDNGAFLSILAGLGNPTPEQAALIATELDKPDLFTKGVVNDLYNDYLDIVDVISKMEGIEGISISEGEVAVLFTQENGMITIINSTPTA